MPSTDLSGDVRTAQAMAQQAVDLIGKNKLGGWESIQALALTSIAKSLAVIAETSADRAADR